MAETSTDLSVLAGVTWWSADGTLAAGVGWTGYDSDPVTLYGPYTLTADDLPTLEAEGYTFKGWTAGDDAILAVGDTISADKELTAVWVSKSAVITYHTDHGTAPDPQTVGLNDYYEYQPGEDDLPALTAVGWTFVEWQTSGGESASTIIITGDTDLYAVWEPVAETRPVYKKTGNAWVKQDAVKRANGDWAVLSRIDDNVLFEGFIDAKTQEDSDIWERVPLPVLDGCLGKTLRLTLDGESKDYVVTENILEWYAGNDYLVYNGEINADDGFGLCLWLAMSTDHVDIYFAEQGPHSVKVELTD